MFLTSKETGIVLYVGTVIPFTNKYNIDVYLTDKGTYLASQTDLHKESVEVIAEKNTYIDGIVGINPEWVEPVVIEKETVEEKLDRIEAALAKVSAGGISAAEIEAAILEGVNDV